MATRPTEPIPTSTFEAFEDLVAARDDLRLIAIDGRPVAGKSTLAERLVTRFGFEVIGLDEFVLPEAEWPARESPAFPFPYVRYDAFLAAVRALATEGRCTYRAFDWETGRTSDAVRTVRVDRPVVVEGVSALHPALAPRYDLRAWVASDGATTLDAALSRGVGTWERAWRALFVPSVELYLDTAPWTRADVVVAGRGRGDTVTPSWP